MRAAERLAQRKAGKAKKVEARAGGWTWTPLADRPHSPAVATVVFGGFEWDDRKAATNLQRHGVSFEEALTVLADPDVIEAADLAYPERYLAVGQSALLRVLFVVHLELEEWGRTRLISARKASPAQRRKYEEG